jgi:hypothetical protein
MSNRETALHSADEVRKEIKTIEEWLDTSPHDGGYQFYAGERSGLLDTLEYIAALESDNARLRERADAAEGLAKALEQLLAACSSEQRVGNVYVKSTVPPVQSAIEQATAALAAYKQAQGE